MRWRYKVDINHAIDFFTQMMVFNCFPIWRQNKYTKSLRKSSVRWDIRQPLPIEGAVRLSSWKLLFLPLTCTVVANVWICHQALTNYYLFCRNEQSAEQEALQLVLQPPLTDMRQLLGFRNTLLAQTDSALQTYSRVPSLCFDYTHRNPVWDYVGKIPGLPMQILEARHCTQMTAQK